MGSFDTDENQISLLNDFDALDCDERRFVIRAIVCERAEVAHSAETFGGRAHLCEIEILADPPDEVLRECRAPPRDLVQITPGNSVVPRVKFPLRELDAQYVD